MVIDFVSADAVTVAPFEQQIGCIGHALHATRDHHIPSSSFEHIVRHHDGFHARATHFGQRDSARAVWQTAFVSGLTRWGLALARHQAIAHQHFFNRSRCDARAFDRFFNRRATQIVGRKARKLAVEAAHRRAHSGGNDDGVVGQAHGLSLYGV